MAVSPLEFWNRWAIQILMLFSLTLHVLLLPLAGIRRRRASMLLRIPLWLAYHLSDTVGIYAIGILSLSSAPRQNRLMPFWAPFLLLHRGGPDSIGAYSFHDNQIWLRHLQIYIVKVLAATYILYNYLPRGDLFLVLAALLMWAVGSGKYAEKVVAIGGANMSSIRNSLRKQPVARHHHHFHHWDQGFLKKTFDDEEAYLRRAHSMFHISKRAMVDSWLEKDPEHNILEMLKTLRKEDSKGMWAFTEMQLSLLYDILYTKAAVIHTWPGYFIRLASSLAIIASFLLFHFSGKDSHMVDVCITYILLVGAFLMEAASMLNAVGSTWAYAFLCTTRWTWLRYAALCTGRWDRLRQLVKTIQGRGSSNRSGRRWSGKMGQYSMLHFCSRRRRSRRPLVGRIAMALGFEDLWIKEHYSATIDISYDLKQELFQYVQRLSEIGLNLQGVIRKSWGQEALEREDKDLYERIRKDRNLGVEFQEGVIIWHIGTDIFLAKSSIEASDTAGLVKSIRTLSNYLMFLLVVHPKMLPGLPQSMMYRRTCGNVSDRCKKQGHLNGDTGAMLKEIFSLEDGPNATELSHIYDLANTLYEEKPKYSHSVPRLCYANGVANELLDRVKEKGSKAVLRLVLDVWMDFVVYAANRCSRESHAKKLSSGGELTTVIWIMTDFLTQEAYARQKD
ncbi:hypothetical protein BS78_06G024600 [Paspalum vaginatum]|nr:hypothetical protein BS78_06G024600 [Paspalum vaginatum]KAJ1270048.1 hypothetical protein BS78_06G024600 [Paspalum vaginatum]